jgi:hypothetical protein
MSFSSLEHAIQWLQENTASHWRQDLQRYFDHQYKYIEEFTVLCHRQKSCLALDLIYPILRHRRWLNTPMFADILTLSCSQER